MPIDGIRGSDPTSAIVSVAADSSPVVSLTSTSPTSAPTPDGAPTVQPTDAQKPSAADQVRTFTDAVVRTTLANSPRADELLTSNDDRYYSRLDGENRNYLSQHDPKSLLNYSLVRDTVIKSDTRPLILSEAQARHTEEALNQPPDPRIQKIVDLYKAGEGSGSAPSQIRDA